MDDGFCSFLLQKVSTKCACVTGEFCQSVSQNQHERRTVREDEGFVEIGKQGERGREGLFLGLGRG